MTGVRVREGEFEGQCDYCREYLPLTSEFWVMRKSYGVRRCRACVREYAKLKQRGYMVTRKDLERANRRATYWAMTPAERAERLRKAREWKAANKDRVAAYRRAYYERRRAA